MNTPVIIGTTLYLPWSMLVETYKFSFDTLDKGTRRYRSGEGKSWACVNHPDDARVTLIAYDFIPTNNPAFANLPSRARLEQQAKSSFLVNLLYTHDAARQFYLRNPNSLPQAEALTEQAAWLMLCAPMGRTQSLQMGFTSVDDFYTQVMATMDARPINWSVANLRRFKGKLQPFNNYFKEFPTHFDNTHRSHYLKHDTLNPCYEEALDTLVSKRYGKRNAAKIADRNDGRGARQSQQIQDLLVRLYADPQAKLNIDQVYDTYITTAQLKYAEWMKEEAAGVDEAARRGWDEKCLINSTSSISNFLFRPDIRKEWSIKRHALKDFQVFIPTQKRRQASFANAKWVIDGTPWHRYYQHDGYQYHRLNVFVVLDAHSWKVCGFYVGESENSDQVITALRVACLHTGFMPWEIQSDNSKAIQAVRTKWVTNQLAKYNIPTEVGNARAKIIEPFFAHFNDRIGKFRPGFSGNPFSRTGAVNMDHLMAVRNQGGLPSREQALREMIEDFSLWNRHEFNGAIPEEKYAASVEASASMQRRFTQELDRDIFYYLPADTKQIDAPAGSHQKKISILVPKLVEYTNRGLVISKKNEDTGKVMQLAFDVPDAQVRHRHLSGAYELRVHPANFDENSDPAHHIAYLYANGKPVMDAENKPLVAVQKYQQAGAIVDRLPGEGLLLAEEQGRKKVQKALAKDNYHQRIERLKVDGLFETAIDATMVHKELANTAKAKLMEGFMNATLRQAQDDSELEAADDDSAGLRQTQPDSAGHDSEQAVFSRF